MLMCSPRKLRMEAEVFADKVWRKKPEPSMGSGIAKNRNKIGKSTAFILFGYKWSTKPIVTGIKERAAIKLTP